MKVDVTKKSFLELYELGSEGIVLMGAGGDLQQWVDGITEQLAEAEIIKENDPSSWIEEAFTLNDNVKGDDGRRDLVLMFGKEADIEMGKMAMWRLRFGDCSWVSDFKVNYADNFVSSEEVNI